MGFLSQGFSRSMVELGCIHGYIHSDVGRGPRYFWLGWLRKIAREGLDVDNQSCREIMRNDFHSSCRALVPGSKLVQEIPWGPRNPWFFCFYDSFTVLNLYTHADSRSGRYSYLHKPLLIPVGWKSYFQSSAWTNAWAWPWFSLFPQRSPWR
jgi:hypothetical protein